MGERLCSAEMRKESSCLWRLPTSSYVREGRLLLHCGSCCVSQSLHVSALACEVGANANGCESVDLLVLEREGSFQRREGVSAQDV